MPPKSIFSFSTIGLKRSVNGSAAAAGACGPCSAASSLARSFASFLSFHSWEATIASQGGSQGQASHPAGGDHTVYTYSYPRPWLLLGHPPIFAEVRIMLGPRAWLDCGGRWPSDTQSGRSLPPPVRMDKKLRGYPIHKHSSLVGCGGGQGPISIPVSLVQGHLPRIRVINEVTCYHLSTTLRNS